MKYLKYITFVLAVATLISSCVKQKFYPDPDDPGLSRFTSKQFLTGTCYINDEPYINYWPESGFSWGGLPFPQITKMRSGGTTDSLDFSWSIGIKKDNSFVKGRYSNLSIRFPIPSNFSMTDLLAWNGKRLGADVSTLYLDYGMKGTANIYFVKISPGKTADGAWLMTGLFDGNIGDSIIIKKGRFDYYVELEGF